MTDATANASLRAAIWMLGAIVSFCAMAVAGRAVSATLDTFELMMYRSLIGLVIVVAVITARGLWSDVSARRWKLQAVRNLAHFSGQNLWFFAVTAIPLAQVFALEFTQPIWVLLLAPLVLGERLTRVRTISALLGFIGILIIVRPSASTLNAGIFAAGAAAVCFAFTTMFTKKLTRTESIACILFWLTLMQLALGFVTSGYDLDIALPDARSAPWVIVVAIGGLLAHFCITNALSLAPASFVIPIDFARVPTIALVGMALYGEALDLWVFVGGAIVFAGIYLNIWTETHQKK